MNFVYPTNEELGHVYIFFWDYYNLQSVYFDLYKTIIDTDSQNYLWIWS